LFGEAVNVARFEQALTASGALRRQFPLAFVTSNTIHGTVK
jgi:hypothetical protein